MIYSRFLRSSTVLANLCSCRRLLHASTVLNNKKPRGFFRKSENSKESKKSKETKNSGDSEKREENDNKKKPITMEFKFKLTDLLLILIPSYFLYTSLNGEMSQREISWQEFSSNLLSKGMVKQLNVINKSRVEVELMNQEGPRLYFDIGSVEGFEGKMDAIQKELQIPMSQRVPIIYSRRFYITDLLIQLAPSLLILALIFYAAKKTTNAGSGPGGLFGVGKSRAKLFNEERSVKVKYKDVAGMEEAKMEIMEFVKFLKNPEIFLKLGAKIPRGAILSGPPGTGKTLLAKATAGEAGVPFLSVSGSEFVEMFVGVGASRVRDLFSKIGRAHV